MNKLFYFGTAYIEDLVGMRNRLFKVVGVCYHAIFLFLIVSWIVGIWCMHQIYYLHNTKGYDLVFGQGSIGFSYTELTNYQLKEIGFHFAIDGISHNPKYAIWQDIPGNFANNTGKTNGRLFYFRFVSIPYWVVVLPLSIFSLVRLGKRRRRLQRARKGLCLTCGYDLRASKERCPECGTEITDRGRTGEII